MTADDDGRTPPVRVVVTRGGEVDAEVVAALTVVVTTPTVAAAPQDRGTPWARAALLEGLGARIVAEPADLERPAGLR